MRRVVLALLVFLPVGSVVPARASAPSGYRIDAIVQGVKLILAVPQESYPHNALVRVTAQVQNLRAQPVYLFSGCPFGNPVAQSVDEGGAVAYPPASQDIFPGLCPPDSSLEQLEAEHVHEVRPGKRMTATLYAIARTDRLRASVSVRWRGNNGEEVDVVITTPSVTLVITRGSVPHFRLKVAPEGPQTPGGPYLLVQPSRKPRGRLFYQYAGTCLRPDGTILGLAFTFGWQSVAARRIDGPCSSMTEWHVVAGWVGQPVGFFDYHRTAHAISLDDREVPTGTLPALM